MSLLGPTTRRRLNRLRFKSTRPLHDLNWSIRGPVAALRRAERNLLLSDRYAWTFGLGVNNSGTTLLYLLLRRHPEVRVLPKEGHKLTSALLHPDDAGVSRLWTQDIERFRMTEADDGGPALRARYDWLHYYERRPGVLFEKSPPNTIRGRWLQHNFTPSRFLVIFRDPYAVAEGIRRRLSGVDIRRAARHWAVANALLLDDLPHLRDKLVLTYEQLCADPETQLAAIERLLGLRQPIDRSILTQPLSTRNAEGAAKPLTDFNAGSYERLSAEDRAIVTEECGAVMGRLGYQRID